MTRCLQAAVVMGLMLLASVSWAASVGGYFRSDGTYVRPHERTNPNNTIMDNYSFPGNWNPNTGRVTPGDPYRALEREWTIPTPQAPHAPSNRWGR